jgi:beta-galactosidase
VAVVAFSNCERVELRLNGRALETRPVSENRAASFEVAYAPGELMAVGFRGGRAVATNTLVTAGKPTALRLELDRESLPADGRSVAHATVSVVDADGHLVYLAQDAVTAEADGSGRLLGLDNGDQRDPSALSSRTKKVQTGQALALLQAGRAPGKLRLRVTAPGLKPAEVLLPVSP